MTMMVLGMVAMVMMIMVMMMLMVPTHPLLEDVNDAV